MTNLILTVISIAVFVMASIVTISYGYDIFATNKEKAESSAVHKQMMVVNEIIEKVQ